MFRVNAAWEIPKVDVVLATQYQHLTGLPYGSFAVVSLRQGSQNVRNEPQGSRRTEAQDNWDVRVSKQFRFGPNRHVEILLDALNVLNKSSVQTFISLNAFSENFERGNTFIEPRRAMFGVKVFYSSERREGCTFRELRVLRAAGSWCSAAGTLTDSRKLPSIRTTRGPMSPSSSWLRFCLRKPRRPDGWEPLFNAYLIWTLTAAPNPADAQVLTGEIVGSVKDESGAVLPGATVTISSLSQPSGPSGYTTDDKGEFRFRSLSPGIYALSVALDGFAPYQTEGIRVEIGSRVEAPVVLKVGQVAENLTVIGAAPSLDTAKSGLSTNIPNELYELTPTRRNGVYDLLKSAPGVSSEDPSGRSSLFSVVGSSADENKLLVDGADTTIAAYNPGYATSTRRSSRR